MLLVATYCSWCLEVCIREVDEVIFKGKEIMGVKWYGNISFCLTVEQLSVYKLLLRSVGMYYPNLISPSLQFFLTSIHLKIVDSF
jgi:hypothetical protein